MGSGVIVRGDGYLLTNNHVVDGADQVMVELSDGRSLKAKVVGTDAPTDLAVLKVDAQSLPTLTLGDSDSVRVGDVVRAVGNPLGVGQTVTMGIVSAKGRATGLGDGSYEDFIQTDAPINRGNSGGALVATNGELIGINSQILTPSGGNIGIGFAIPANMARNVMTQLIEHGEVRALDWRSEMVMEMLRNASLAGKLGVLVAAAPVAVALIYAVRPTERRLSLMRPLSLAAIFGGLTSLTVGLANVLIGISATGSFGSRGWHDVAAGAG